MQPEALIAQMQMTKEFFDRSTRALDESDASHAPFDGAMTAAQQIAHVAQTVDWFFEGAFRPEGFSLDFDAHAEELRDVDGIGAAREWLDRSFAAAEAKLRKSTTAELAEPMADGPVMGGQPRFAIVGAIADHTAHHRGVLTVYTRLRGKVPPMPYMEA